MKNRLSVSIDEDLILKIRELIRQQPIFRNKSHVVEYALYELIKRKDIKESIQRKIGM